MTCKYCKKPSQIKEFLGLRGRILVYKLPRVLWSDSRDDMPRKARIDAPGALHHIIARGIERRAIFTANDDRQDRQNYLRRLVSFTHSIGVRSSFFRRYAAG